MTPQATRNDHGPQAPYGNPRPRLTPSAVRVGFADGAWWSRSEELSAELPNLSPLERKSLDEATDARLRWESEGGAGPPSHAGHPEIRYPQLLSTAAAEIVHE
ncbi:DUF5994 family protein [Mycolicibacterium vaccae]|uniref:DUF5994 family protein n=1 Tax=Mycolicibacterium vaccae TaxID=1810 RepID=UPI001C8F23F5|nr:DUF5994 family protein [Mycolicibacterium vaccae]